jgi:O-antigen/teichoic acid export membrane protein
MGDLVNTKRNKIIKDTKHYVVSSILGQGISLLRSILMPFLFNPAQLGIWNLLNLILSYTPHAQIGLMHGMNKGIPLMKGKNNLQEEVNIRNSVFLLNLFLSIILIIICTLVSFYISTTYRTPFRILSILLGIQMLYYFYFSLLRSDSKFILVSNGIFLTSFLSTLLVILFAYFFKDPVSGGIFGLGFATLIVLIYWIYSGSYSFQFYINWKTIKRCLYLGFPILAIGILDSFSVSLDRIFLAVKFSKTELGYYALGLMISGVLSIIPGSVASVLYTTMLERFSVNSDPKDLKNLLITPIRVIWALMVLIVAIVVIVAPILIKVFIPKYLPSIPVVEILVLGSFFMACTHIPSQFLISINKQKYILYSQVIISVLIVFSNLFFLKIGMGIKGIAISTSIGYMIYGINYTVISLTFVLDSFFEIIKYVCRLIIPIFILIILYIILNNFFFNEINNFLNLKKEFGKLFLILFFTLIPLYYVNLDGLIYSFIKAELLSKLPFLKK